MTIARRAAGQSFHPPACANGLRHVARVSLIAPLIASLAACGARSDQTPPAPPVPEVGVVDILAEDAVLSSDLPGRIAAYRVAEVRPQVSGIILRRLFEEGSHVRAGQTLYEIDPASYRAAHEQAEAALANARANLLGVRGKAERYAQLLDVEGISRQEHDDAQAAYAQAAASVKAAAAAQRASGVELARARITAPIAGRIGRSMASEGALVTAGQETALASVLQLDPIHVDIVQPSQALLGLRRRIATGNLAASGTRVTLRMEDGSRYEHAGVLKFSEVNVDAKTGAVTLRAQFPNPQGLLLPGMYVRAEVEQGVARGALLVPQQGVRYNTRGEPTALVVGKDHRVAERVLTTQGTRGDRWVVSAGIRSGEQVIVEGLQRAAPGDKVRPVVLTAAAGMVAAAPAAAAGR